MIIQETVDEIIILPKKRRNIKQVMLLKNIIKVEHYKISKSLKD